MSLLSRYADSVIGVWRGAAEEDGQLLEAALVSGPLARSPDLELELAQLGTSLKVGASFVVGRTAVVRWLRVGWRGCDSTGGTSGGRAVGVGKGLLSIRELRTGAGQLEQGST